MMERESTGLSDKKGNPIFVGDVLFNDFACDKWNVVKTERGYEAWLIPNSGAFGHPDNEYPAYQEELDCIAGVFEIISDEQDGGAK